MHTQLKHKSFEDFLRDWHAEIYPELLDDDMSDHFDNWLGELDGEDYIKYAELYGKEMRLKGMEEIEAIVTNHA